ncbi:hypothetical protein GCM10017557_42030 [Streptomyces aurantiacus]|uniref:Uncharacterized protein n=1 Tax=Streptomyces aurantiacus TaxID=47760 RepID=A0A7G1P659_9ACTN|nr:hypothetical protein [Streptomyces aurantiacus]BCL29344.1 hypothetical protein GCM10017557_42030 [Streptomyces aurantiacus]
MPASNSNAPVCRDCGGFPVVSITTGARHRDGSRVLLRVVCGACRGAGRPTTYAASFARAGR